MRRPAPGHTTIPQGSIYDTIMMCQAHGTQMNLECLHLKPPEDPANEKITAQRGRVIFTESHSC